MQQCATLGSARLSLLVWNDSACPTTARELPQRTPAIVPQQESERSGIDGRRLLLSAQSASRQRSSLSIVLRRKQVSSPAPGTRRVPLALSGSLPQRQREAEALVRVDDAREFRPIRERRSSGRRR